MQLTKAAAFLKALGTSKSGENAKWMQARCPLAPWTHANGDKTPSFAIRKEGQWAHCFGCQFDGSLFELCQTIERNEAKQPSLIKRDLNRAYEMLVDVDDEGNLLTADEVSYDDEILTPPIDPVWPESYLEPFEPAWYGDQVHPYLAGRGVSVATAKALDLRFDSYRYRVCFPLRDLHGRLRGLHGRAVSDAITPPYWFYTRQGKSNPQVFHNENQVDFSKPIIVAESVFDLAAIYPFWQNIITPRSVEMRQEMFALLSDCPFVITWFDNDKAGDIARAKIEQRVSGQVMHVSCAPYKDAGIMPVEAIKERVEYLAGVTIKPLLISGIYS